MRKYTLVLVIALIGLLTSTIRADWQQQAKLTASDAEGDDRFGQSVSISGDYAIVGAHWNDDAGANSGSAYIFQRQGSNWTQAAKLVASDATGNFAFGYPVSISGDYAILGSFGDDHAGNYSGSAYVFHREGTSWLQQAKLIASDPAEDDQFGSSLSISGDYAIVGAGANDDAGNASGSAYIFERDANNWTQAIKLTASDAAADDWFGWSTSISGDYAIVGAYANDDDGNASGSAYIFKHDGENWTQQAKLTASDAAEGDAFGYSVSISGDHALVGSLYDADGGTSSGSAYIFRRDGENWTEEAKLTASDATTGDWFGWSLCISEDRAIVGAGGNDDDGDWSGSAYVFQQDGTQWSQVSKLTASDGAAYDEFGASTAISGDYAIVGSHKDDDAGELSGSAYIFTPEPATLGLLLIGSLMLMGRRRMISLSTGE